MTELSELVIGEVHLGYSGSCPVTSRRETLDLVVRQIQCSEVSQLSQVARDLSQSVVGEVEALQRMHPVVGGSNGKV